MQLLLERGLLFATSRTGPKVAHRTTKEFTRVSSSRSLRFRAISPADSRAAHEAAQSALASFRFLDITVIRRNLNRHFSTGHYCELGSFCKQPAPLRSHCEGDGSCAFFSLPFSYLRVNSTVLAAASGLLTIIFFPSAMRDVTSCRVRARQ